MKVTTTFCSVGSTRFPRTFPPSPPLSTCTCSSPPSRESYPVRLTLSWEKHWTWDSTPPILICTRSRMSSTRETWLCSNCSTSRSRTVGNTPMENRTCVPPSLLEFTRLLGFSEISQFRLPSLLQEMFTSWTSITPLLRDQLLVLRLIL